MTGELVQCPFDPSHAVKRIRFPIHITKCRQNHPHVDLVPCPYNAMHWIPQRQLADHMGNCPDNFELAASES
uniref:CHHC U11-48K-type domain-containing protein n=1 Tax=Anopheles triannulatus TaxID=58253 RepID=A0A2M4AXJ9_9DIPT